MRKKIIIGIVGMWIAALVLLQAVAYWTSQPEAASDDDYWFFPRSDVGWRYKDGEKVAIYRYDYGAENWQFIELENLGV